MLACSLGGTGRRGRFKIRCPALALSPTAPVSTKARLPATSPAFAGAGQSRRRSARERLRRVQEADIEALAANGRYRGPSPDNRRFAGAPAHRPELGQGERIVPARPKAD